MSEGAVGVIGDDGSVEPGHLAPLTPLSYLARSRLVYGDRLGTRDGGREFTYSELFDRSARLAGVLRQAGVARGDRVAFLSPNTHVSLEGHFGVAAAEAVLVAMNTLLSPDELGQIATPPIRDPRCSSSISLSQSGSIGGGEAVTQPGAGDRGG